MSGCEECGAPTGSRYNLCQTHRVARRNDDPNPAKTSDTTSSPHQCLNCHTIWDVTRDGSCPECGRSRRRYVGPLGATAERDDGTMIIDSQAVIEEGGD